MYWVDFTDYPEDVQEAFTAYLADRYKESRGEKGHGMWWNHMNILSEANMLNNPTRRGCEYGTVLTGCWVWWVCRDITEDLGLFVSFSAYKKEREHYVNLLKEAKAFVGH
jgi:hypothetical protein